MDPTDADGRFWNRCRPISRREDGRGRPRQDTLAVLNGVFWILRTGAPWHDLPARYPPYQIVIAASNNGSVPGCSPVCCRNWPKTYAIAASWICAKIGFIRRNAHVRATKHGGQRLP